MSPILRIRLFGEFSLIYNDEPLTTVNTPRLQSLLAYLVLHRDMPQPRRQIAFSLWPDLPETRARANLRKLFYQLQQALPEAHLFLQADNLTLRWQPTAPFTLDVAEFEKHITVLADLRTAIESYTGDLLPDCYDDWIVPERGRLRQLSLEALEHLIGRQETDREYGAALINVQRLLQVDPLREEVQRHLMRLQLLSGDRAAALHTYQNCVTVLQRELGVEPGAATRQVYELVLDDKQHAPETLFPIGAPNLIGRAAEWTRLQATWHSAVTGKPQLMLITGEAGIGKTRLAEELLAWVDRQGIPLSTTHCYAAEGALAYAPLTTWLRERPLAHLEPSWLSEVARLAPELASRSVEVSPAGPLTEPWQRQRFREALARAILGPDLALSIPLLLLIEDVQWCDGETLEWLHFLLRFNPRAKLLIIATQRTEMARHDCALDDLLTDLRRRNLLAEIDLAPLDRAATIALAQQVAGREIDTPAADQIYQETEGIPLFVVEFMRAGLTMPVDVTSNGVTILPPVVQAAMTTRLAQLSSAARQVMELAAVIGREFTFKVLATANGIDEDSLVQALDELWQRHIIREQGKDAYNFSHDKLRQVAYSQLSGTRRRRLHRKAAEALSASSADRIEMISGQIGWHYEQAGDNAAAAQWLWRAGDVATRVGAYVEAVAYLKRALECLPADDPRRAELMCRIGLASSIPYDSQDLDFLQQALDLAQQLGDRKTIALARLGISQSVARRGHNQEASQLAEAALTQAKETGDQETAGRALLQLGRLTYFRKEYAQALHYLEEGLVILGELRSTYSMARGLNLIGLVYMEQGNYADADRYLIQALELCQKNRDRSLSATITHNLGWVAFLRGQYVEAEQRQIEAMPLFREVSDHGGLAVAHNLLGHIALRQGNLSRAMACYRDGLAEAEHIRPTPVVLESLAGMAGVWAQTGVAMHAAEIVGLVIGHPHCGPEVSHVTPFVLQLLRRALSPAELEAALKRGRQLDLNQVMNEILRAAGQAA
jgi:predicted ATPase/DNA-binding SARP family transcriptional activator